MNKNLNETTAPKRSWNDITVKDFQAIYKLNKEDPEEKMLCLIALVNGLDMEDVYTMPISKLEKHFSDIDFLTREPRIPLMKPSYTLNGTKYNVHAGEMLTMQYIDFKQMLDTYYENLPRFLTIFLIPDGHKYGDGYDLGKAAQDISTMSITDARAVASFFLTAYGMLTGIFLRSSVRRLKRQARRCKDPKEKEMLMQAAEMAKNLPHTTG